VKVVFLDIDGVLNSGVFNDSLHQRKKYSPDVTITEADEFDPVAISMLNRLLDLTGAVIVISSSWRLCSPVSKIWMWMQQRGFTGEIIGVTPWGRMTIEGYDGYRGDEITAWLEWTSPDVTDWVAIDDYPAEMMRGTEGHFVKIEGTIGLQDADVRHAIAILMGE